MEKLKTEQLRQKIDMGDRFHLVNVLPREDYMEERIPGSINIPLEEIDEQALENFDKHEEIVLYCGEKMSTESLKAARKLEDLGFENIKEYIDGMEGWREAGLKLIEIRN